MQVALTDLVLPIAIAGVLVHFVSFVMWMVLPHHKSDWGPVPDEDGLMAALRAQGIGRGMYMWPHCGGDMQRMKDPAFQQKMAEGPSGMMTIMPKGPMRLGKMIALSIVNHWWVALLAAYVTSVALAPGAPYLSVFRVAGGVAFAAYAGSVAMASIWYHQRWSVTFKTMADGVLYALVVAGVFGWLWPDA